MRCDDASDALRSSPDHAGAHDKVVLAQGLGHEDRKGDEKGRGPNPDGWPWSCTASGLMAPSSGGPGKLQCGALPFPELSLSFERNRCVRVPLFSLGRLFLAGSLSLCEGLPKDSMVGRLECWLKGRLSPRVVAE
jgi:hypothetical protein